MSDREARLDPDLLADLDAGLLDGDQEAEVRAAAASDRRATAVLAALAATRADLAALPEPPVPPDVAAGWDAALAAEARRGTSRGRRLRWPAVAASAGLAATLVTGLLTGLLWTSDGGSPSLDQVDLVAAARAALGAMDTGELADPARRAACLREVAPAGVTPDAPLLGGRHVTVGGEPAVLLVLASGELGRFHVVVVDEGCGPDGGRLLRSESIGR